MGNNDSRKIGNYRELEELYYKLCTVENLTPVLVIKIIMEILGGAQIYIPSLKYFNRIERDEKIRRLFRGGNYGELSALFSLSERRVRMIVHRSDKGGNNHAAGKKERG